MLSLQSGDQVVKIEGGELVSYCAEGYEYIHQKGDPGWRNSDIEMFPIIGPTAEAGFRVHVPRGNAIMDQHGLLREMDYEIIDSSDSEARFKKHYTRGQVLLNSKFPEKSTAQRLIWPFEFEFEKHFLLSDSGLQIQFRVSGERDMPFMIGYHPAFKLRTRDAHIQTADRSYTLQEIMEAGNRALEVADCSELILRDEQSIRLETEGFGNFMLWTEVPNMVCIEPISYYPYSVEQHELHQGFMHLNAEEMVFKVNLLPL